MSKIENTRVYNLEESFKTAKYPKAVDIDTLTTDLTDGIKALGQVPTGTGHDNFLKGIVVYFDMTFSNKAWAEAERYHFLEFVSSQSTMHKINKFDIKSQCNRYVDERCISVLQEKVNEYNRLLKLPTEGLSKEVLKSRKEAIDEAFLSVIYNIPSGFELTAGMVTNYQQLKTIYQQRRNHRLKDWQVFCDWCETLPMFMELTQKEKSNG